eukprot:CAMPEP_0114237248 /NCGR_PEP_ID=MMETSP0058-20121206/7281_1 /TAXON_ID=36894 /ORGANISM="Pyramimonas parkeae, CCMP726" /LENGTH=425 /DNA_ID=CAMNT_0001349261 /DNA_START=202 /DNA_END=1479 /DNA_ORIENTATION=-
MPLNAPINMFQLRNHEFTGSGSALGRRTFLHCSPVYARASVATAKTEFCRYKVLGEGTPKHACAARQNFVGIVERGEAVIDLARAALYIAAEDDALVTHSAVELPVEQYTKRLESFATEIARHYIPALGSNPTADKVISVVDDYLFGVHKFQACGRSSELAYGDVLDHPGVWEDARDSYLNAVLTRRRGSPAAIAILYADVMQRLLLKGSVDFAVRMQLPDTADAMPSPQVLPMIRRQDVVIDEDAGILLNTCTSEALVQMLRHLKRAYWPMQWDTRADNPDHGVHGSGGGFLEASRFALGEVEMDAYTTVVSRTAKHRLDRGIWTSTGAGDMRRARAACEKLVLLAAEENPTERRDLAALLVLTGDLGWAEYELQQYLEAPEELQSQDPTEKQLAADLYKHVKAEIAAGAPLVAPPPPPPSIPW